MPVAKIVESQSKVSWWLGLDRKQFQREAKIHADRIRTLSYSPPTAFQLDYRSPMTKARQQPKYEVGNE